MFLPKIREIKEALVSLFSKPYTSRFPFEEYKAPEEFRGWPKYHEEFCVGCGTCAQVCPPQAITMTDNKETGKRTLTVNKGSCIHCGQCQEKCITEKGIQLSSEYSSATMDLNAPENFETIEKDILLCEMCGVVIACEDHLHWIKERLGAKAYAHPNLLLQMQKEFFGLEPSKPKDRVRREDQIKLMCAKCRYKVVVEDEFYHF
jgi:formate hydrogenlyase subunit 6/NADH:ubiquinone oxidoreductase subunit I